MCCRCGKDRPFTTIVRECDVGVESPWSDILYHPKAGQCVSRVSGDEDYHLCVLMPCMHGNDTAGGSAAEFGAGPVVVV